MNSGYTTPQDLGSWMGRFQKEQGIEPKVMFWQLLNDNDGGIVKTTL
jgi:hypothetical protein